LKPIPWSRVKSWRCLGCGDCCKLTVQLMIKEWLNITRTYGYGIVKPSLTGLYLRKTIDGLCPFLIRSARRRFCSIQSMKPIACKIWPFKILSEPKYGKPREAYLKYRNRAFYIYVNPQCHGFVLGKPNPLFINKILSEFIDIRLGLQREPFYSTSNLAYVH
jgi:Fe-S-cluster containining protein